MTRTKIDPAVNIALAPELSCKYGLHPQALADVSGTDDGLQVRKTAIVEDSPDTRFSHRRPHPSACRRLSHPRRRFLPVLFARAKTVLTKNPTTGG